MDFRAKNIARDREWIIYDKRINLSRLYICKRATKYVKQELRELKVETDKSTVTVRYFNALSKQMIEQLEKKIRKNI